MVKQNKMYQRMIAIKKIQEKYGENVPVIDIVKYLKLDYGIKASRQQVYRALENIKESNFDLDKEEHSQFYLESTLKNLIEQYKDAKKNYENADSERYKVLWSKRMTDISRLRHVVEKELDELKALEEKTKNQITYQVIIEEPKLTTLKPPKLAKSE